MDEAVPTQPSFSSNAMMQEREQKSKSPSPKRKNNRKYLDTNTRMSNRRRRRRPNGGLLYEKRSNERPSTADFASRPYPFINFYFVMQGQTRADRDGLVDGWSDTTLTLTKQGKAQATALGKRLSKVLFDRIYSSDLERARVTAALIMNQQQQQQQHHDGAGEIDHDNNIVVDYTDLLREMAQGHRELKPTTMSLAMATRVAESAEAHRYESTPNDATGKFTVESVEDVRHRAESFIAELLFELDYINVYFGEEDAPPPEPINVLVISHQGFLQQLFRHVFKIPSETLPESFRLGSLTQIDLRYTIEEEIVERIITYSRRLTYVPRSVFNDIKHLQTHNKETGTGKAGAVVATTRENVATTTTAEDKQPSSLVVQHLPPLST